MFTCCRQPSRKQAVVVVVENEPRSRRPKVVCQKSAWSSRLCRRLLLFGMNIRNLPPSPPWWRHPQFSLPPKCRTWGIPLRQRVPLLLLQTELDQAEASARAPVAASEKALGPESARAMVVELAVVYFALVAEYSLPVRFQRPTRNTPTKLGRRRLKVPVSSG